ncbi:MAG: EF-hand domain-containing protein, partial [Burkholderiales bacterium]|nr:EF-hand domain-containing protein [Burkholderiales bacterium]
MSTIGSISASSASAYTSSIQRQRPDASQIADSVFSKLDTKSQGYLEIADLESAFSSISSDTSSTTSTADSSSGISALFKKLDSNNDGKVTKDEFSRGLKKLSDALETQFNARRTSGVGSGDDTNRPPPPPPNGAGGPDGAGLTKDQLTELASKVSNTNSTAGAGLSSVAQNFDAADTNQDGKVSMQETLAYLEKAASTSTSST